MASYNGEQQQLDELQARIDQLRLQVPSDPDDIRSGAGCHAMRMLKESLNEQELLLEKRRVDEVKESFDQGRSASGNAVTQCQACSKALRFPTMDGALCKAFLNDDDFDLESDDLIRAGLSLTLCCGKIVCMACFGQYATEACPGCQGGMPGDAATLRDTIRFAEGGDAWAQFEAGERLLQMSDEIGVTGREKQRCLERSVGWFRKAALQGVAAAAGTLALKCKDHMDDPVESRRWLDLAAELGEPRAQMIIGAILDDEDDDDFNDVEAVKWYTLTIRASADSAPLAAYNLASHFREGTAGLGVSLPRARHYYQIAAEDNVEDASYYLSMVLFRIGGDTIHVPGCCTIPRSLHWAKESLKRGDSCDASQLVPTMEKMFKGQCSYCSEEGDDLLRCGRCKIFDFCSQDCQKKYWQDGHKYDCVALDV